MIILDTNVLSEPLRAQPEPAVLAWLAALTDTVALTAISVGEILAGVRLLPAGRRREGLADAIEKVLAIHKDFAGLGVELINPWSNELLN